MYICCTWLLRLVAGLTAVLSGLKGLLTEAQGLPKYVERTVLDALKVRLDVDLVQYGIYVELAKERQTASKRTKK